MRGFRSNEWVTVAKEISFDISENEYVELWVVGTEQVAVHALPGDQEGPPVLLQTGTQYRIRRRLEGFQAVRVTSPSPFSYQVSQVSLQVGEPINDDDPPAPPLPGSNLLAQMRQLFANEFARNRPVMLDPDELPFADRYLVEDDDLDFEEELAAKRAAARKKKAEDDAKAQAAQTAPPNAGAAQPGPGQEAPKGNPPGAQVPPGQPSSQAAPAASGAAS